jgi:hypothetical protein
MTEIKDINMEIAEFVGDDPETLSNMGEVHAQFKDDVVELLEKAFVHVKKRRVMKELLEFAESDPPLANDELDILIHTDRSMLTSFEWKKIVEFHMKFQLWLLVSEKFWYV